MTRSIFDPTGGDTERSGSSFTPPDAGQLSHMPPDAIDGIDAAGEENDVTEVPSDALDALPATPGDGANAQDIEDGDDAGPALDATPRNRA